MGMAFASNRGMTSDDVLTSGAPMLIISPHLDDGVFSCGKLLASVRNAVVATVFAGNPGPRDTLTEWDSASGFVRGDDVVAARRLEDSRALEVLGARHVWLDFYDSQYGDTPREEEIVSHLRALLTLCGPRLILFPLGLFHSDHKLVHEAALGLMDFAPDCAWIAYEDALYRRIDGALDIRLDSMRARGFGLQRCEFTPAREAEARKRAAVACYRSQLMALTTPGRPGIEDVFHEEVYWQVLPGMRQAAV